MVRITAAAKKAVKKPVKKVAKKSAPKKSAAAKKVIPPAKIKEKKMPMPEAPDGITMDDIKLKDGAWKSIMYDRGEHGRLTFYKTERFGWCIRTLYISRGKGGQPDRFYGIALNGQIVTIGNGPHVKAICSINLTKERAAALKKFMDLYDTGMGSAGEIRDRISTRRANTQLRKSSWLY